MPKSYKQILRSFSLIGGSQAVNLVIGMVRTKVVAILLGPSGVGLMGLYQSATSMVGTLSGLGIGQSAIREVAVAHGTGDAERIARTVTALRRACWVTGALGWLATAMDVLAERWSGRAQRPVSGYGGPVAGPIPVPPANAIAVAVTAATTRQPTTQVPCTPPT